MYDYKTCYNAALVYLEGKDIDNQHTYRDAMVVVCELAISQLKYDISQQEERDIVALANIYNKYQYWYNIIVDVEKEEMVFQYNPEYQCHYIGNFMYHSMLAKALFKESGFKYRIVEHENF